MRTVLSPPARRAASTCDPDNAMVAAYDVKRTSGTASMESTRMHPVRPETMSVAMGSRRAANVAQPIAHRKDGMRRGRVVSARRMFRAGNSYRALSTPAGKPTSSATTATSSATTALFCRALTKASPTKAVAGLVAMTVRHKRGAAGSAAIRNSIVMPMVRHLPGRSSVRQEIMPSYVSYGSVCSTNGDETEPQEMGEEPNRESEKLSQLFGSKASSLQD